MDRLSWLMLAAFCLVIIENANADYENPPAAGGNGICPYKPQTFCAPMGMVNCHSDSECKTGSHCCTTTNCGDKNCMNTCKMPMEQGPCKILVPSWYYDNGAGICKKFTYGGCGGNANRFDTQKACREACRPSICSLSFKMGPCKAAMKRWYFDSKAGFCKVFIFGGCQGNGNLFETELDCRNFCRGRKPSGTKTGQCPSLQYDSSICRMDCEGDYYCPGAQKCCVMGCNGRCENPVTIVY
jgi:hypothetical protein